MYWAFEQIPVTITTKTGSKCFQTLMYLAEKGEKGKDSPVLIAEIAKKKKIPLKFLENILLEMKNAGILESKKGKGGGYYFAKNPKDVPLATVMRLLDGPISLLPCVSLYFYERCKNCDEKHCGLHGVMAQVRDANLRILEKKTIADLAKH
jgi:Rrf2 family protein